MPDPFPRVPCRQPSLPGCFRHSYNAPLSKTRSSLPRPVRHPEPSGKTLLQAPTPSFHVLPPSGLQRGQTHPCPRRPDPEPKGRTAPPPEVVDGEEHYVVEKVLDSRLIRGRLHFLVKWEGYGYEENTWVAEEDMAAPAKVQEFYQLHPGAPRRIRSMAFKSLMSRASRTQHPRRGGDVRGPPISNSELSPRQFTHPEVHQTETRTQVRSSDVTPRSRHEIHRTEHWPGYHSTGYGSWGQHTFRPNQRVRYAEEACNGQGYTSCIVH